MQNHLLSFGEFTACGFSRKQNHRLVIPLFVPSHYATQHLRPALGMHSFILHPIGLFSTQYYAPTCCISHFAPHILCFYSLCLILCTMRLLKYCTLSTPLTL